MYSTNTTLSEGAAYYCYNIASDGTIHLVPYITYNASPALGIAANVFTQAQDDFRGNPLSPCAWNLGNDAPHWQNNTGRNSRSESVNDISVISSSGSDSSGVQLSDCKFTYDYSQSRSHQTNKKNRKKNSIRTDELYRVPYTEYQKQVLEQSYSENDYLVVSTKLELAKKTNLDPKQVKIWFQNRRAKDIKKGIKLPKPKPT